MKTITINGRKNKRKKIREDRDKEYKKIIREYNRNKPVN